MDFLGLGVTVSSDDGLIGQHWRGIPVAEAEETLDALDAWASSAPHNTLVWFCIYNEQGCLGSYERFYKQVERHCPHCGQAEGAVT